MFWGHRLRYGFVGRNETGHSVVGIDLGGAGRCTRSRGRTASDRATAAIGLLGDGRAGAEAALQLPDANANLDPRARRAAGRSILV